MESRCRKKSKNFLKHIYGWIYIYILIHTTMHGSMNIKFMYAKQATELHAYWNTKRKLYKTNAATWFNKTFRNKQLTPNYINIKINGNSTEPYIYIYIYIYTLRKNINSLNAELSPICHLLALLGVHYFLHVSRIRVKSLTLRLLMSYIYGASILDVSRSHTTTQHSR